ncbi:hypothetical protein CEV31_0167 [Brucella thiophenivorans]|uniref:Uncharacterized protein n=1 Tax=Brucella thiophenivorans TaxID=571255 RepID=A0A256G6F2_9HYPH|nr:hypothetical protein CEV31_0167 [Brucella thiophenivorans]
MTTGFMRSSLILKFLKLEIALPELLSKHMAEQPFGNWNSCVFTQLTYPRSYSSEPFS